MEQITEEIGVHEKWYEEAKEMTIEKLPEFINRLTEEYEHDYGTICHAMAAAAMASIWAIDKSPSGGITGFQAGAIMWQFIRKLNYDDNKTGMKIVDYDNMLSPQYEDVFDKTIGAETWSIIKKQARKNIEKADDNYRAYIEKIEKYHKDIKAFVTKYPDYYDRKKHYDLLGMGNADQWEQEDEKKNNGFEFAPKKPFEPLNNGSPVYDHWVNIVSGKVPFGYSVKGE